MTFSYSIDGVSLLDPAGRWWVTAEGSGHSPAFTRRSLALSAPGMNGIVNVPRETRDAAPLNLRVMTRSNNPATREAYWEAIKALFVLTPTFTLGRTVAGVARTATAKTRSISEPDFRPGAGMLVGAFSLTILDGLFHGPTIEFGPNPFTADFASAALPGLGGNAPIEDWAIRVKGPVASAGFTDTASGTGVSWVGALATGQYLFLAGAAARISTNATDWASGGSDASGGVSYPAAGLLELTPKVNPADVLQRNVAWSGIRAGSTFNTEQTLRARSAHV